MTSFKLQQLFSSDWSSLVIFSSLLFVFIIHLYYSSILEPEMDVLYTEEQFKIVFTVITQTPLFSPSETIFLLAILFPTPNEVRAFLIQAVKGYERNADVAQALYLVRPEEPHLVATLSHRFLEAEEKRLQWAFMVAERATGVGPLLETLTRYADTYYEKEPRLLMDRFRDAFEAIELAKWKLVEYRVEFCVCQNMDMIRECHAQTVRALKGDWISDLIEDTVHTGYRLKWEDEALQAQREMVQAITSTSASYCIDAGLGQMGIAAARQLLLSRRDSLEDELCRIAELS